MKNKTCVSEKFLVGIYFNIIVWEVYRRCSATEYGAYVFMNANNKITICNIPDTFMYINNSEFIDA
jgi:hypothetical protein